jgi:hypothetical protein
VYATVPSFTILKNNNMLILIADPYRSGTNDDPELMKANLDKLEAAALPLFRMGHIHHLCYIISTSQQNLLPFMFSR